MEQTQILSIVVASPGDVQNERDLLQNVIEELNRGIAAERGLVCTLSRWETDTYPGFHAEGPQALIDPILKIAECDLVIGIFWKRFGTPTADGKTGTEHEFVTAYEAWKEHRRPQIFVYFNQKAYSPKSKAEIEQWGKVIEFRERFPKEGLWWPYDGKAKFEKLVRNHLTNYIRNLPKSGDGVSQSQISSDRGSLAFGDNAQGNIVITGVVQGDFVIGDKNQTQGNRSVSVGNYPGEIKTGDENMTNNARIVGEGDETAQPIGKIQKQSKPTLQILHGKDTHFFWDRIRDAFPGVRGVKWFNEPDVAVERLLILLRSPLEFQARNGGSKHPIWWWRGHLSLMIDGFSLLDKTTVLIDIQELIINKVAVRNTEQYQHNFVYVETKPTEQTGLYVYTQ